MRLPVIKSLTEFIEKNDEDYIIETAEVLEHLSMSNCLKEPELEIVGELLSNMFGAVEVAKKIAEGTSKKDALNEFMKRVMGSIDK